MVPGSVDSLVPDGSSLSPAGNGGDAGETPSCRRAATYLPVAAVLCHLRCLERSREQSETRCHGFKDIGSGRSQP